jgi:Family of unknown function (DUF5343)
MYSEAPVLHQTGARRRVQWRRGRPHCQSRENGMARKNGSRKAAAKTTTTVKSTEAKFPYTTKPGSLRRLLKNIPGKPKPAKFDIDLLRSWDFKDANDHSMLRVLKAVRLLNDKNEPTEIYTQFMNLDGGPGVLGAELKRLYASMFTASHTPYNEPAEKLQNLFNIHSGGGDRALELQIQTFKALCESATFDGSTTRVANSAPLAPSVSGNPPAVAQSQGVGQAAININLHIHLPENKTRREYEDIIEDIGRYIFGRTSGARRD